jgi:PPK2 family polyphosphate:nucleotide phosphotransferase
MMICEPQSKMFSPEPLPAKVKISEAHEDLRVWANLLEEFRVEPGSPPKLGNIDPSFHGGHESHDAALTQTLFQLHKMDQLQNLMFAERKHSLLIVLQGLDACGKDGLVRHIVNGLNPAGCRVVAFKQPTPEELGHDFLWRVHRHVPARGEVVIFNRSHYEDVLVVRVHQLAPVAVWSKRYDLINDLEKLLVVENGTTILKFFLHISKEEQLGRFKRRLDDPSRRCKISESDYREREYWQDYIQAFEDMLHKTSTRYAPWFVIPADHKWFRDLAVSQIIMRTLDDLDLQLPETAVDIARIRRRYHDAEVEASASCPPTNTGGNYGSLQRRPIVCEASSHI